MPEKGKQSSEDQKREDGQLQIRLCTKYAVPDAVFNLPTSIDPSGLASLVRGLLPASSPPDFDWLSHSELLRGKLGELLSDQKLLLNLSSPSSSLKRASPQTTSVCQS